MLTSFLFFNATAPTEIYTLSLHDALPISPWRPPDGPPPDARPAGRPRIRGRSEEHTSELQSHVNVVCRLLLEKKKSRRAVPNCTSHTRRMSHTGVCEGN